ncbi:MAG: hypothetical protein LBF15_01280 [Candidatus Peribacteria bacterium]|jgi:hypothetical protein|nr:hypothetical protein [Candidatus Peribacteria bacterium]
MLPLSLKYSYFKPKFSKYFLEYSYWSKPISINKTALILSFKICFINFSYNSKPVFSPQNNAIFGSYLRVSGDIFLKSLFLIYGRFAVIIIVSQTFFKGKEESKLAFKKVTLSSKSYFFTFISAILRAFFDLSIRKASLKFLLFKRQEIAIFPLQVPTSIKVTSL